MPHEMLIELKDIFATRFDREELADFALEIGIDYEDLSGGDSRAAKARALAQYIARHVLLDKLLTVGEKRRSDIPWREIYVRYGIVMPRTEPDAAWPPPAVLQQIATILADRPLFLTPEGRRSLLVLAGADGLVAPDLNGSSLEVASRVVTRLNSYGRTREGDNALGRLVAYLLDDPTLPPDDAATLNDILARLT